MYTVLPLLHFIYRLNLEILYPFIIIYCIYLKNCFAVCFERGNSRFKEEFV